jgi:hypothetical protein
MVYEYLEKEADEDDIYSNEEIENLRDDDELDEFEAAFMFGYNLS